MTKDQTIALVKTIQESAIFIGKCLMEIKIPNANIEDDVTVLNSAIEDIIADIPDDASNDVEPNDNQNDNQEET